MRLLFYLSSDCFCCTTPINLCRILAVLSDPSVVVARVTGKQFSHGSCSVLRREALIRNHLHWVGAQLIIVTIPWRAHSPLFDVNLVTFTWTSTISPSLTPLAAPDRWCGCCCYSCRCNSNTMQRYSSSATSLHVGTYVLYLHICAVVVVRTEPETYREHATRLDEMCPLPFYKATRNVIFQKETDTTIIISRWVVAAIRGEQQRQTDPALLI